MTATAARPPAARSPASFSRAPARDRLWPRLAPVVIAGVLAAVYVIVSPPSQARAPKCRRAKGSNTAAVAVAARAAASCGDSHAETAGKRTL